MRNIMLVFAGIICSSSSVFAMYGYNYQNQMQQRPSVNANGELTFPNGVVDISGNEFAGNTQLKKIVIPNEVRRIGYSSFANCTNVTSIQLSTNLREIDNNAFAGLSKVRDLVIPASVKRIGQDALSGMSLHSLWFCDPDNCNVEELGNIGIAKYTNYKAKERYQARQENVSHHDTQSKKSDHSASANTTCEKHSFTRSAQNDGKLSDRKGRENVSSPDTQSKKSDHSAGANTKGEKHSYVRSAQDDGKLSDRKGRENVSPPDTQSKKSDHLGSTNTTDKKYSLGYPIEYDSEWRDRAVLALQNAGILDQNGKLTEHAIAFSHQVFGWERLNEKTRDVLYAADKNANWCKYATKGIQFDGCKGKLEVHFYMDEKTKKLYLDRDYKLKDNDYKPLRFQTKYDNPKNGDAEKSKPAPQSKTAAAPKVAPASKTQPAQKDIKKPNSAPKTVSDEKKSTPPTVKLTTLMLPDSIMEIGELSYHNIDEEAVTIYQKIKSIGYGSFVNCKNLKKVRIYNADIGPGVFFNCPNLKLIDIRGGVKSIGNNSFSLKYEEVGGYGNYGPESIKLHDNLETIGNWCFNNLNAVNTVSLGTNLTSIGYGFMAGNDHCQFNVRDGEGKENVKQLLINAGISADRINK